VARQLENKDLIMPGWLKKQAAVGMLIAEPTDEEIVKQINLRLVVEYYSR